MRILNICGYTWAIGGPAKIIFDHAQVQLAQGHEVSILTPIWPHDRVYPAPDGAKVITVKRNWVARFFPEFSMEAYHWLKKNANQYDIIHIHGVFHFAGILPFIIKDTPPKAITIHGVLDRWAIRFGYWKKKIFSWLIQRRIVGEADLIQINNTDEWQDLKNYLGFQHPNVVIIPNGMRMRDFSVLPPKGTFRNAYQIAPEQKIILFMGRLNIKKGLDLLLPAYANICQRHPDAMLILAGPDDGYQAETEQFIKKHQLQNRILMPGMLTGDIKLAALADADVFVLPSYSEGFSIAVLEAMSARVPALVSDRVGFGEAIREHQAGHLVELTSQSVEEGLDKMLHDAEYGRQLSENAYQLVKNQYDIEIVASNLICEFQKVVSKQTKQ
ncbi:MAG: glycosyltransferase [Spirosomataceae bacterium]